MDDVYKWLKDSNAWFHADEQRAYIAFGIGIAAGLLVGVGGMLILGKIF